MTIQIGVTTLAGSPPIECSHCLWRFDGIQPPHPAAWLLQWHPREHTTVAWLVCSGALEHALNTVSEKWETFLLEPPQPAPVPVPP